MVFSENKMRLRYRAEKISLCDNICYGKSDAPASLNFRWPAFVEGNLVKLFAGVSLRELRSVFTASMNLKLQGIKN